MLTLKLTDDYSSFLSELKPTLVYISEQRWYRFGLGICKSTYIAKEAMYKVGFGIT